MSSPLAPPLSASDPFAPSPACGALRLSDWGVIRAQGDEAAKFLQGQLTQDVLQLPAHQARLAGYCSPKGRLLASFVVWQSAPDEVLLACSADVLSATLKRLSMFVMRARCKLTDASADWPLWGLVGANLAPLARLDVPAAVWGRSGTATSTLVRLPAALADGQTVPRFLLAGGAAPELPELAPQVWLALEACSGVARVMAATSEQFVPQMVNLELVGGVDFGKGCFPGQEVVARSQYRGTLKRRGFVMRCQAPLAPGQEVFHDADPLQPAGMVVLAGSLGDEHHVALIELKIAALNDGNLHLGSASGPLLQVQALPYAIPADTP